MIYPQDITALVMLKFSRPLNRRERGSPDLDRAWQMLKLTSRSFAAVIEQLHPELRDAVMLFYIVLRALDTLEDDTGLDDAVKTPLLRSFARDILKRSDWTFHDSSPGEKDAVVLREFDVILREFHKLRPEYQDIIADITNKMGNGMADYVEVSSQKNYDGLQTIADYDLYCHHVAGIVGEGLTRLAAVAGFVTHYIKENPQLYESMGLFLQKTNIIRDYREDMDDGRSFWPREVWEKYTPALRDFTLPENEEKALQCLSNLAILSLEHVIDCLDYLAHLKEPSYFKFCAIPQVMSIATLELVFNNPAVFQRNVKIRRGLAAQLILRSDNMGEVYTIFRDYVRRIHARNRVSDPNYLQIEVLCGKIETHINANDSSSDQYRAAHNPPGQKYSDVLLFGTVIVTVAVTTLLMYLVASIGFGAEFRGLEELKREFNYLFEWFAT